MTKKESKNVSRKRKTKKKEEFNNDVFMLTMLLAVTCLLATSLKAYEFTLFNCTFILEVSFCCSKNLCTTYGILTHLTV